MKKIFYFALLNIVLCIFPGILTAQVIRGTYAIKNVQTGMLLRIKDANGSNGTPLVAYSPVNWKCVTWDFKHVEGNTYQLKNLYTGKTFQPKAESSSQGVVLEQQPLTALQQNQLYEFIVVEKNVYMIRAKNTDLFITAADKDNTSNSGITLAKKDGSKLQYWTIYEQHPTM